MSYVISRHVDGKYLTRRITVTPAGASIGPEEWTEQRAEASRFIGPVPVPAGYACFREDHI